MVGGVRGGGGLASAASRLQQVTPHGRDRLVDLIRAVSILVVVLGHWLMADLQLVEGELRLRNVLAVSPALQPATWFLQVMPLFFVAAGFTTALALRGERRDTRAFWAGRTERVLNPTLLLVALWLPLAWVLPLLGVSPRLADTAGQNAAMVLWFLAVYLVLTLVAPLQLRVHRRAPWLLLAVLPILALLLDRTQGTPLAAVGFANYVVVFAWCAELGVLYAEGRLTRLPRRVWWGTLATSLGLLLLATGPGPYPVSMIGLPGQEISNMLPPSVCVVLVAATQLSLVLMVRPALLRWLDRPTPWLLTVAVNRSIMTIFLWHLTAFVAVAGAAVAFGAPFPEGGSAAWWGVKVLWVVAAAVVTLALVLLLSPVERRPAVAARRPGRLAGAAVLLAALGMTMVASAGFADPFERGGVSLAGLTFAPAPGVALLVLAAVLLRWPRSRPPDARAVPASG